MVNNKIICFLAPANNSHTHKWCKWFYERGYAVHVISFVGDTIDNVNVHVIGNGVQGTATDLQKLRYFTYVRRVNKVIAEINPDIISVHYATSYGCIAALSDFRRYTLSVWGTDIFNFPNKSILHKLLLMFSLSRAPQIFATSYALAKETQKYTRKPILITPFGVDMNLFRPAELRTNRERFVVGTIKALSERYGIDYLLKAVAIILKERPDIPIELHVAGRGDKEWEYKTLAENLGITEKVQWLGYISQERAAVEWQKMDLAVLYSAAESFGVSAVEAQACGVPLIVSDAPGFQESTKCGESSIVIPFGDERRLAEAILELYDNNGKRKAMSQAGREYVVRHFDINECFLKIEDHLQ